MEAQRYPDDFNGIIAAAPANNWSNMFTGFVWNEQALSKTPDSAIAGDQRVATRKLSPSQNNRGASQDSFDRSVWSQATAQAAERKLTAMTGNRVEKKRSARSE